MMIIMNRQCLSSLAVTYDKYNMQNLDFIADELFNKIRGRFPSVTIGDAEGNVTNEPKLARYFDFNFVNEGRPVGKVSVSLDDKNVAVVYGEDLVANETELTRSSWYDFLKELRMFARKRTLAFDTRDITKSNLNTRDYKFLANNRGGDENMNESKMYGTSKVSYQDFDGARLMIKHTEGIDQEAAGGRSKKVGTLYIESSEGERFKYPYKHVTGARAMARHVAEGGNAYDDFGKHIVSMSEEMNKLRKFKTYMGRSAVMAESLAEYVDVVKERIATVKKTLESLQRPSYYKETFEAFAPAVMEDVPTDVAENWIDQLTIRQFNEELSDVFPYIYKLVSEASKADEVGPDELDEVAGPDKCWPGHRKVGTQKGTGKNAGKRVNKCKKIESDEEVEEGSGLQYHTGVKKHGKEYMVKAAKAGREGASQEELGALKDKYSKAEKNKKTEEEITTEGPFKGVGKMAMKHKLNKQYKKSDLANFDKSGIDTDGKSPEEIGDMKSDYYHSNMDKADRAKKAKARLSREEMEIESAFEEMMGQFAEGETNEADEGKVGTMALFVTDQDGGEHEVDVEVEIKNGKPEIVANTLPGPEDQLYWDDADIEQQAMDAMKNGDIEFDEGNAYAHAVKKAKMNGKKKGDKIDGPDGDEITLEKDEKTPLGEFILSYFDRENGQFPKGETAVLTMVEKDYGEKYITPAKEFIEMINNKVAEVMGYKETEEPQEIARIRELSGL